MAVPGITGSALPFSLAQDLHPVARFFPSLKDKFHKYVRALFPVVSSDRHRAPGPEKEHLWPVVM
jgi:hypothetical protein